MQHLHDFRRILIILTSTYHHRYQVFDTVAVRVQARDVNEGNWVPKEADKGTEFSIRRR